MARTGSEYNKNIVTSDVVECDHDSLREAVERLRAHQLVLSGEISRLRSLSALGENVATVAHEIRNPLSAMAGFAELLARRCADRTDLRDLAGKIMTAAQNLNSLVQKLLDLARNTPLDIRPIEWQRFLDAALDQFEEQSRQRGGRLTLVRRWGERLMEGRADPLCLRQAIWNILENAEQANGANGEIEIAGETVPDGRMRLVIADRGTGVDPNLLPRLFTPFVTTREQGTGLGLVAARKIVEAHGGRITLRNREGGGVEVLIELPGVSSPTMLLDPAESP